MKILKRAISLFTALSIMSVMFTCLGIVPAVAAIPDGYEVKEQITLTFNNSGKGWSGTNSIANGTGNELVQVDDPDNSSNKYMSLSTPNGSSYNMELADGDTSTTAYKMTANTTYNVKVRFKVVNAGNKGALTLVFGTQAAYNPSLAKPYIKTWSASEYDNGDWNTVSYDFTTTATMQANTYDTNTAKTNVCDRMYLIAKDSACEFYIDEVTITKYGPASTNTGDRKTTLTFNNSGTGWSGTNGTSSQLSQINDPNNSANKYMSLSTPNGNGYNMELANADTSTTAYKMTASTSYTITIKFKVVNAGSGGNLSLNFGTQAAYSADLPKPIITTWSASDYNDGNWHTVSYDFTTTSTMQANTYNTNITKTNVCDRMYLVAKDTACKFYIDEVTIAEHSGAGGGNEEGEEKEMYTISDFTHGPYNPYTLKGQHTGTWYCSLRWYTDSTDENSVMHYKFAYDIAENAPNTSGTCGIDAKGTNGAQHASMCLAYEENTPITLTQGKSYRISFKYKVLSVENNSYVSFVAMRGKYSGGWTASHAVGATGSKDDSNYIIDIAFAPTDDWVNASYTFTANYTSNTDFDKLQIGGAGYGEAIIDDIVVEEIDASEVLPNNNDSAKYDISAEGTYTVINSYKLTDPDLTIPAVVSRRPLLAIGNYTFLYNKYVKNVTIENGPNEIRDYAFQYARVLETVNIPVSVTNIGKGAFYGIKTLKAINVDVSNANYTSVDGVLYNKDMTELILYPAAKTDKTFTVPDTVVKISDGAFYGAENLETVNMANVTEIGRRAFINCSKLVSVSMTSTVTSLGASAFRGCTALTASGLSIADDASVGENSFAGCDGLYTVGNISGNDGTVDILDATTLVRHLAGWQDCDLDRFQTLAADINGDGTVDLLDAVLLKRHLASWKGYETLPCDGTVDYTYNNYTSSSDVPELVVNLTEKNSRKVTTDRDIEYDPNKEDVILILVVGQSNSTTGVGYSFEVQKKNSNSSYIITEETARPAVGTVFSGANVTALTDANDVYYLANPSKGTSCMGGYTPALGKALNEATGAKIVFVQAAVGAVGMHEWVPNPEDYTCTCINNGGGKLYSNAIANYTKTYQALQENYNIIATSYIYNQGEHEEHSPYVTSASTVHDDATYEKALLEMHNGLMSDCEIDIGGLFVPRSFFARYSGATDIVENSRRPSYARTAMYSAANKTDKLFIFSNFAENMCAAGPYKPDPTNSIHYSQIVYNNIGKDCADSLLKYLGVTQASEFEGITVYNKVGTELCRFNAHGNLVSGSDTIAFSDDNSKLYFKVMPTGTMYTYEYSVAGTDSRFVSDYGIVTAVNGQSSFKIVINPVVK